MAVGEQLATPGGRAAGFFFVENPEFLEQLKLDPSLGKALNPTAQAIARGAKQNAKSAGSRRRADNVRAYNARVRDLGSQGGEQQVALVVSTSPRWHWLEYGVNGQPALHVMENAARDVVGADMFSPAPQGGEAPLLDTGGAAAALGETASTASSSE